jgi:hypothetical protein
MRKIIMKILLMAICITFVACSSAPELSKEATHVNLVDSLPASEADKYIKIDPIECKNSSTDSADENRTRCRTDLRNHAIKMGADVVVIDGQQIGKPGCESCVRLNGFAYKTR